jgi:hypothetical protein
MADGNELQHGRRRLAGFRTHLRHNLVGYLALFVALGGTAAGAGYVVSSNGQLGPGTVAGSAPPQGKHDNVINNSLTASDIKPDSIGGGRIVESTLGTVPNADKVDGFNGADLSEHAGFGLQKYTGLFGEQFFQVSSAQIQRRVATPCPPATAVRLITQSGAPECVRGPMAYSAHDDDTGIICNNGCTEGSLSVPAGLYAVSAKIRLDGFLYSDEKVQASCRLSAGSAQDVAWWVDNAAGVRASNTLHMQVVTKYTHAGDIGVYCQDNDVGDVYGRDLKITAIRLGGFSDVQSNSG